MTGGLRPERRRPPPARFRRRRALALSAGSVGLALGAWALLAAHGQAPAPARPASSQRAVPPPAAGAPAQGDPRLVAKQIGSLSSPVQDAAAAPDSSGAAVILGGLTAGDLSRTDIRRVSSGVDRALGRLPVALHDAAAVLIGGEAYVIGGGDGVRQLDQIVRVNLSTGRTSPAGTLPTGASDVAAAVVGDTAYIVGGYTGSRWLGSILAFTPGRPVRTVGRLPQPLRYAAVAAVAGRIVIAGGSTPAGASSRVFSFDPRSRRLSALGRLPVPTTHAAAGVLAGRVVIIGGRGDRTGSQIATLTSVDPVAGRIRPAGRLSAPLSDAAAVSLGERIAVLGGRGPGGTEATIREVSVRAQPTSATSARPPATTNVYAGARQGNLAPIARSALPRVYVPNGGDGTVSVIDPATFRVVGRFSVGDVPQHVTPSWDLRTLWVSANKDNSLTPIDPRTARPSGPRVAVADPYNLYFTPDGASAIVVAEALARLDFRDPQTMLLQRSVPVPCRGVDHMDFTADGRRLLASCEFSGQMVEVDLMSHRVVRTLDLPRPGAMPQDVKLSPDGSVFYVADMASGGLWVIDATTPSVSAFIPTGKGAHGLYPSRDARLLYISNRGEGTVSVLSFATGKLVDRWTIPGGGSPDMGGVSADGRTLWLTGRYHSEVYALDTRTGRLRARIPVGRGPHGLAVWPQPGRYSLGHTGDMR